MRRLAGETGLDRLFDLAFCTGNRFKNRLYHAVQEGWGRLAGIDLPLRGGFEFLGHFDQAQDGRLAASNRADSIG